MWWTPCYRTAFSIISSYSPLPLAKLERLAAFLKVKPSRIGWEFAPQKEGNKY